MEEGRASPTSILDQSDDDEQLRADTDYILNRKKRRRQAKEDLIKVSKDKKEKENAITPSSSYAWMRI